MGIGAHGDGMGGDEAALHERVDLVDEGVDFGFGVDDFEDDGKVTRELEDFGRVHLFARAEGEGAAQDGTAGEVGLAGEEGEVFVEGAVFMAIAFAQVDAQEAGRLWCGHVVVWWCGGVVAAVVVVVVVVGILVLVRWVYGGVCGVEWFFRRDGGGLWRAG